MTGSDVTEEPRRLRDDELRDHSAQHTAASPATLTCPSRRDQYQDLAQATDRDPLGGRAFHNHLAELSMLGILDRTKRNEGRAGGIYYEYQVDVPFDAALSTLENLHLSNELDLESLQENAREKGLI
jgi:archaeal cell division control protein 6